MLTQTLAEHNAERDHQGEHISPNYAFYFSPLVQRYCRDYYYGHFNSFVVYPVPSDWTEGSSRR